MWITKCMATKNKNNVCEGGGGTLDWEVSRTTESARSRQRLRQTEKEALHAPRKNTHNSADSFSAWHPQTEAILTKTQIFTSKQHLNSNA